MVVLAMVYTRSFYGLTYVFRKVPIRPHFKPAIGAFLTGAVGLGPLLSSQSRANKCFQSCPFGYGSFKMP